MPKITITIEAEIDDLEAECFNNNMTDEDLDGQADLIKDILRMGSFSRHGEMPKIWWKIGKSEIAHTMLRGLKPFSYIQKVWKEKVCTESHYTDGVLIFEQRYKEVK